MQKKTALRHFITLTFFLLFSASLFAQMSDKEVISEMMKYQSSGMSQQQIFQELTKKGVTVEQLQRLKTQYENKQNNTGVSSANKNSSNEYSRSTEKDAFIQPRLPLMLNDSILSQNRIFGQDFFSQVALSFEPNMNMPTPANYVLGAGDEIIIDVWGDSELNFRYKIAPDGFIMVPGIGRIQLNGMTVEQATPRIRNAFSTIYSDLDSSEPHTFLAVSVGNIRSIRVNVMGEVVTPGTYTLSSFATAFHALYSAGGINNIGSLRNIRVFRNGKTMTTIDLYEYLMKGNSAGDITLRDNDVVMVSPYNILAQITGEVKRPMYYEMRNDETLADLIRFAGGFKGDAYKNNVELTRKGSIEMEAFTPEESQYAHFRMQDGDKVIVGNILDKFTNMVVVSGAVNRPGKYAIGNGIRTVKELVNIAGGTTGDAFLARVLLNREKPDLTRTMESIDLEALMQGKITDISLQKNDSLFVSSVLNLEESRTVYIGGEVQAPGSYPYADNMSIEEVILRAGGFKESASTARIDVYRRIKNPGSATYSSASGQAFSFSLTNGLMNSADKAFTLQPFDQVVVRQSPGYEPQKMITVTGEVLFGGQYAKLNKDERLSSFIKRAGGLTPQAYSKGARLIRRLSDAEIDRTKGALKAQVKAQKDSVTIDSLEYTQPVGIDLAKALERPGGQEDIILREGDELNVPYYTGTVKISGAVMYPNTVTYIKGMGLDAYVRQAGGYARLAMKTKPYVVYMNGKVASGRWAKIEPGCEIVVPEKPDREPMSLQAILGISSSIATLALLITNLVK